jgi:superfamily II DNA or RNA helicase
MRAITGREPTIVLHTEPRAHVKLDRFRQGRDPWIVAVNMVSEGVDIPRLRVGVYATVAKTPLIFRQIVGRFVRVAGARREQQSWLYLPADPYLRGLASTIEDELRHGRRDDPFGEEGFEDQDELEPREPRPDVDEERPAFVPLSADVAPQMNLFGEPEAAPRPVLSVAPAPEPVDADEPGTPLYALRAAKRAERHRLVGSLRRLTGETFQQINARLNGKTGVKKVEDATVEQLDKSISLLLDELTAASRRGSAARR